MGEKIILGGISIFCLIISIVIIVLCALYLHKNESKPFDVKGFPTKYTMHMGTFDDENVDNLPDALANLDLTGKAIHIRNGHNITIKEDPVILHGTSNISGDRNTIHFLPKDDGEESNENWQELFFEPTTKWNLLGPGIGLFIGGFIMLFIGVIIYSDNLKILPYILAIIGFILLIIGVILMILSETDIKYDIKSSKKSDTVDGIMDYDFTFIPLNPHQYYINYKDKAYYFTLDKFWDELVYKFSYDSDHKDKFAYVKYKKDTVLDWNLSEYQFNFKEGTSAIDKQMAFSVVASTHNEHGGSDMMDVDIVTNIMIVLISLGALVACVSLFVFVLVIITAIREN